MWTQADQDERRAKKRRTDAPNPMAHDTIDQRERKRLQMHIAQAQRKVDRLRERLQNWDPLVEEQLQQQQSIDADGAAVTRPKQSKKATPSTPQLKGAARPAWQVYDFDTRYVDPHVQAHEQAKQKAQRTVNLLATKAKLASNEIARDFLGALMQSGHLYQEAKLYKSARKAFLECMDLDVDSITTARESLMRLYVQLDRTDSALRLGAQLSQDDSVWIRYSSALVAFRGDKDGWENLFAAAIKAHPLCAFYLSNKETFDEVMEYTDELLGSEAGPQSSLEDAIDYATSDHADLWVSTGARDALKRHLHDVQQGKHSSLTADDVDWRSRLDAIAEALTHVEATSDAEAPVDVNMYIGMFRTAMEMVER